MYKMYGAKSCPSCVNARAMMKASGISFLFIDITDDREKMPAGHKSIPVIYDSKGDLIGGYNDLLVHLS